VKKKGEELEGSGVGEKKEKKRPVTIAHGRFGMETWQEKFYAKKKGRGKRRAHIAWWARGKFRVGKEVEIMGSKGEEGGGGKKVARKAKTSICGHTNLRILTIINRLKRGKGNCLCSSPGGKKKQSMGTQHEPFLPKEDIAGTLAQLGGGWTFGKK